jgi:hypothetical protein
MRRGIAAVAIVAILAAGCGKTTTLTHPSAETPLTVSPSLRPCPASDETPSLVLSSSAGDVLVPGQPTSALICRYWGGRTSKINGRLTRGELGHAAWSLAGARRIVRQDVTSYLASELNALPPISPHANCDEELSKRSELIVFYTRGAADARVQIIAAGCIPVSNGQIERSALNLGHGNGELPSWLDEDLL